MKVLKFKLEEKQEATTKEIKVLKFTLKETTQLKESKVLRFKLA